MTIETSFRFPLECPICGHYELVNVEITAKVVKESKLDYSLEDVQITSVGTGDTTWDLAVLESKSPREWKAMMVRGEDMLASAYETRNN